MSEISPAKAARRAEEAKALQEKKKLRTYAIIVVAIVAALVLFVALFGSNLFYNTTTAVAIGGEKYSVADFNYNYFSVYNSYYTQLYNTYGSLASQLMPNASGQSLRDVEYSDGMTWADYIGDSAIERMTQVTMLCSEAEKESFTLPQEDADAVEETIAGLKTQSSSSGFASFQAYLTYTYGKGMTEKVLRENLLRDAMASAYSEAKGESFTYTADELKANYQENKDDYDYFVYRSYFFSGAAVTDDEDTEEDETVSAEDAMADAQAKAAAFLEGATDEESFIAEARKAYEAGLEEGADASEYDADAATKRSYRGSSLNDDVKDWLTDADRKAGDITTITTGEDASAPGVYVLCFLSRDDNQYQAVSGYYAIVPLSSSVNEDDYSDHETYHIKLEAATTMDAQLVLDSFNAEEDKSLEGFMDFCANTSTDVISGHGPLDRSGIYDVPESISEWLFSSDRKQGDTTVIYDEDYGCFVLYYDKQDGVYADLLAEANLRNDAYSSWETEALKNYTASTQWEMRLSKRITAIGG